MQSSIIFSIAFALNSCSLNNAKSSEADIYNLNEYDNNIFGLKLSGRTDQNCCECTALSCSIKKCCSAPANCECSCSNNWFSGPQCTCNECHIGGGGGGGSSWLVSYELWLTPIQYGYYEDFSDILENDGSLLADSAMIMLSNSLDAIDEDDFTKFSQSKLAVRSYCIQLSASTQSVINSWLSTNGFDDEL